MIAQALQSIPFLLKTFQLLTNLLNKHDNRIRINRSATGRSSPRLCSLHHVSFVTVIIGVEIKDVNNSVRISFASLEIILNETFVCVPVYQPFQTYWEDQSKLRRQTSLRSASKRAEGRRSVFDEDIAFGQST